MLKRSAITLALLFLAVPSSSKDKKKETLPEMILRARYVAVVIDPDTGMSVTNPLENRTARTDVEAALAKWGRFKTTLDPINADLIMVVRKGGKAVKPTIGGGTRNDRPVVLNPGGPGDINVGVAVGIPPRTSSSDANSNGGPSPRTEIGPSEDILSVYRGGVNDPLDSVPLWRYAARNGLQHPSVPAVDKFRKAIEEAEKAKP
jgi:hypothetical protein